MKSNSKRKNLQQLRIRSIKGRKQKRMIIPIFSDSWKITIAQCYSQIHLDLYLILI